MTDEPRIFEQPASDYHADYSRWSQSALKVFRERRRVAHARYVARTLPPDPPTAAMERGTVLHAAVLEPERVKSHYATYPQEMLATNGAASTKAAKAFAESHRDAGICVLKADDMAVVEAMAASVRSVCDSWLALPCKREYVIHWTHEGTGLPLKCRPDWLIETPGEVFVIDLKTTADASPRRFRKSVEDFSYWFQFEHYREGAAAVIGKPCRFYFVAVESEYPYQCAVYDLDAESQERGRQARERTLEQLADCIASGDWSDDFENVINVLSLKPWTISPDYQPTN